MPRSFIEEIENRSGHINGGRLDCSLLLLLLAGQWSDWHSIVIEHPLSSSVSACVCTESCRRNKIRTIDRERECSASHWVADVQLSIESWPAWLTKVCLKKMSLLPWITIALQFLIIFSAVARVGKEDQPTVDWVAIKCKANDCLAKPIRCWQWSFLVHCLCLYPMFFAQNEHVVSIRQIEVAFQLNL